MPRITEVDVEQAEGLEPSTLSGWTQSARRWLKGTALLGAGLLGYTAVSRVTSGSSQKPTRGNPGSRSLQSTTFADELIYEATDSASISRRATTTSDGLLACYQFDGNVLDTSGNDYTATLYGATPAADRGGRENKAYSFDGVDDYISLPVGSNLDTANNDVTVAVWFNPFTPTVNVSFVAQGNISDVGRGVLSITGSKLVTSLGSINATLGATVLDVDKWHHGAVVYEVEGATAYRTVYLDGEVEANDVVANPETSTQNYLVAKDYAGRWFNGTLDDLRIYDRVLSADEIKDLQGPRLKKPISDKVFDSTELFKFNINTKETYNVEIDDISSIVVYQYPNLTLPIWLTAEVKQAVVSSYTTPGSANDVALLGSIAYVADGVAGLQIVNVTDPTTPTLLGTYDGLDNAITVVVSDSTAYVADGSGGLRIINVTDSSNPTFLGKYDPYTDGNKETTDVVLSESGHLIYAAFEWEGLRIINVDDPTAPFFVGDYDTPDQALGVAASGNVVFVADRTGGFISVNVTDPTNPTFLDKYDPYNQKENWALDVAVAGNIAYAVFKDAGLKIINITDPSNIDYLGTYNTPGRAEDVVISGSKAYVADGGAGLQIIDVTDPSNPSFLDRYDSTNYAKGLAVSGSKVFVADGGELLIIEKRLEFEKVSYAGELGTTELILTIEDVYGNSVTDEFTITVNQLPVVSYPLQDQLTFVNNPFNLQVLSSHVFHDSVKDTYLLTAKEAGELTVPSWLSFNMAPEIVSTYYDSSTSFSSIKIKGKLAYTLDSRGNRLLVFDISQLPLSFLGSYQLPTAGGDSPRDLAISGNIAFIVNFQSGLQIIDAMDPTNLAYLSDLSIYKPHSVAVSKTTAYVGSDGNHVKIIDVTDPRSPSFIATYGTSDSVSGVAVSEDILFIAESSKGLRIVDVTNPATPSFLSSYDIFPGENDYAKKVTISGNTAFVSAYYNGLAIVDISDLTNPSLLYTTSGYDTVVAVYGRNVFVPKAGSGLRIFDITDPVNPSSPVLVGSYNTPGSANGVDIYGNMAFVVDGSAGLQVISIEEWEFTGTPTEDDVGNYVIDVTASDVAVATVTDTFTIVMSTSFLLTNNKIPKNKLRRSSYK